MTPDPIETKRPDLLEQLICFSILVAAGALIVWFRSQNLVEDGAYHGYLPSALVDPSALRPSTSNFPSGEIELLKSLPMNIYPILGSLGVSGGIVFRLMLALEVISLATGAYFAVRSINPRAGYVGATLVALCMISSNWLNSDISRWGHPYYGSVYNYAYGFGLAGIALIVVGRPLRSGLMLGFATATHPILGFFFSVFAACGMIINFPRYKVADLLQAALAVAIVGGAWLVYAAGGAQISGNSVPASDFISLTRMMSFHWYPVDIQVFTTRSYETFVPFLSFCALLIFYLRDDRLISSVVRRQLAAGFIALVLLTIFGVVASEFLHLPFLIKLALHRASLIILILGSIVVIPGLWIDLAGGRRLRAFVATLILLLPFVTPNGVPIGWTMALLLVVLIESRLDRNPSPGLVALVCLLGLAAVMVWLSMNGYLSSYTNDAYTALTALFSPRGAALLIAAILLSTIARRTTFMLVALGLLACFWTPSVRAFKSDTELKIARDYLAVQEWARRSTAPQSLFVPDPVHSYGWREYSHRASFGSVREWLYAGWIYDTKSQYFDDGQHRLAAFDIDWRKYAAMTNLVSYERSAALNVELREKYYNFGAQWFYQLKHDFGAEYFVFDRRYVKAPVTLPIVYQNDSFIVGHAS